MSDKKDLKNVKKQNSNTNNDPKSILEGFAKVMSDHNLSEIDYSDNSFTIKLNKGGSGFVPMHAPVPSHVSAPAVVQAAPAPVIKEETAKTQAPAPAIDESKIVKSPMVGTVYVAPNPDSDPFIKVGDEVKEGDEIFIIECMKTMNKVKASHSGTVKEIFVNNSDPVEYDSKLVWIE